MSDFDARRYLNKCHHCEMISLEGLTYYGTVSVLVMAILDLILTLSKMRAGPFIDANPLAQIFIENGVTWGLICFKLAAATFFGWMCLKNLTLVTTQVGVAIAAVAHLLLAFHWVLVF